MKVWLGLSLLAMACAPTLAAPLPGPGDSTNSPSAATSYTDQPVVIAESPSIRRDEVAGKKFKVTGFLVRPFKAMRLHKAGGALASVFQAINPFSSEKASTEGVRFEGELSTLAWSSSIGWRAGNSGRSNPVTHEVGLTALSVSR